jgi:hypothetical protein
MKFAKMRCIAAVGLLTLLTLAIQLAAQGNQNNAPHHHHYQFIDLGTFGGPVSYFANGFDGILNSQGKAVEQNMVRVHSLSSCPMRLRLRFFRSPM